MIIVDKVNKLSGPALQLVSKTGVKIFFHEGIENVTLKKQNNLQKIFFKTRDNIGCLKYFDFPSRKKINDFCERFWPKKTYQNISKFFPNISNLDKKLIATFASLIRYHTFGALNLFAIQNSPRNEKVFIIHTNLLSFLLKNNGTIEARPTVHLFLPFEFLQKITKKIQSFFGSFFKRKVHNKKLKKSLPEEKKILPIGVVYHQSLKYGHLFSKSHLLSVRKKSPLYFKKIKLYVLFAEKQIKFNGKQVIPLAKKYIINKNSFYFLFYILKKTRTIDQFYGSIIAFLVFSEYQGWVHRMRREMLKVAIIDYDILFPKPLSLALESLGIKTVAFQERPAASFYHKIYTTFASAYLFAGALYKKHALRNNNVFCEKAINFGMWRVSKFFKKSLPPIKNVIFKNSGNPFLENKKNILFLGYFYENGTEYPLANEASNAEFLKWVEHLAIHFPDKNLVVRYKGKIKNLKNLPVPLKENIYFCNDFSEDDISYTLCKASDLIVSCQTSLAEECIYYGKKVVLIENLFTISKMIRSIYPKEFWFLAAQSKEELVEITKQYFLNSKKIVLPLQRLKNKIKGEAKFQKKYCAIKTLSREVFGFA
jgi:hypothetical protein